MEMLESGLRLWYAIYPVDPAVGFLAAGLEDVTLLLTHLCCGALQILLLSESKVEQYGAEVFIFNQKFSLSC